jgi:hypothetical protein
MFLGDLQNLTIKSSKANEFVNTPSLESTKDLIINRVAYVVVALFPFLIRLGPYQSQNPVMVNINKEIPIIEV